MVANVRGWGGGRPRPHALGYGRPPGPSYGPSTNRVARTSSCGSSSAAPASASEPCHHHIALGLSKESMQQGDSAPANGHPYGSPHQSLSPIVDISCQLLDDRYPLLDRSEPKGDLLILSGTYYGVRHVVRDAGQCAPPLRLVALAQTSPFFPGAGKSSVRCPSVSRQNVIWYPRLTITEGGAAFRGCAVRFRAVALGRLPSVHLAQRRPRRFQVSGAVSGKLLTDEQR